MIKFENTEVIGWEHAIRGMRNPMNSWERSDSRNNIITLCGSSRFKDEYLKVQKELSLKGYLVLSLGLFGHSGDDEAWAKKDLLDRVHKQKIDMSSAIFVIDVDGYVGESTKNEIEYAINLGKTVYFYSHDDLEAVQEASNSSLIDPNDGMWNPMNSWEKSDSYPCGFVGCAKEEGCEQCCNYIENAGKPSNCFYIGPNDFNLMKRLRNAGTDHRKFMRMITVYVDITAPLYWWKEFDTYKVGTVANSCSTMHKIAEKEFTLEDFSCEHLADCESVSESEFMLNDPFWNGYRATPMDVLVFTIKMLNHWRSIYLESKSKIAWWQMIQLLPSSYNQKRTVMMNYEVLANIYKSRNGHKLDEWREHDISEEKTPNFVSGAWGFCDWIKTLPYSELITNE